MSIPDFLLERHSAFQTNSAIIDSARILDTGTDALDISGGVSIGGELTITGEVTGVLSREIPDIRGNTGYNYASLRNYILNLSNPRQNEAVDAGSVTVGAPTIGNGGYQGGAFSPDQNRIYLGPAGVSNEANWHYIDCSDGSVVGYAHGFGTAIVDDAFQGSVYSPTQKRIYLVPNGISDVAVWYYIDCTNGSVEDYTHGFGTTITNGAFRGGVYSPTQDRIYLISATISDEPDWYYIDCGDNVVGAATVVKYTHGFGTSIVDQAFIGGVYSPTQDRIYLVPFGLSDESTWYYIDCSDNVAGEATVVAYTHGFGTSITDQAFGGGVYSPTQDRIYLVSRTISDEATWYYIDCGDNVAGEATVVAYTHGFGTSITDQAFYGGVYSPTQNRIYLVPLAISDEATWYYIDRGDNIVGEATVVAYTHGFGTSIANKAFIGGVYSPIEDRVYLTPNVISDTSPWYFLKSEFAQSGETALSWLTGGGIFNHSI